MFDDVLKKISEPIDIGVILIFYAIGAILQDTQIINTSFAATSVAAISAIGGLGVKKTIEAISNLHCFVVRRRYKRLKRLLPYLSNDDCNELCKYFFLLKTKLFDVRAYDKKVHEQLINPIKPINWGSIKNGDSKLTNPWTIDIPEISKEERK